MVKLSLKLILLLFLPCQAIMASDPTRPPQSSQVIKSENTKTDQPSAQPLTGIFKKHNRYTAVIDGEIYREGEYYQGNLIEKITSSYVQLTGDKGRYRLTLIPKLRSQPK